MQKKWMRQFWFVPPVLIALVFFIGAPLIKRPPQKSDISEYAVKARVIKVPKIPVVIKAVGYGLTRPVRTWEATAETAGKIVWISDKLKSGKLAAMGTEVLRIDDSAYKLALAHVEAQLNVLDIKDRVTTASLALEERGLALLKKNIERERKLGKAGVTSKADQEEAERTFLKAETVVQNLKNTINITAGERKVLQVQKETAEFDLKNTQISAPFDVRITEIKVNPAQYVNKGQFLFSADDIETVEIEARFPIGKLRPLIVTAGQQEKMPAKTPAIERIPASVGLKAIVRLKTATHSVEWEARVDRVSGIIDLQTQTMGVWVIVDKPYEKARPGQRPALVRNTFVEVELSKKGKTNALVVPTSAIHDGKVYVMNTEKRLVVRNVKTGYIKGGAATIEKGLKEDETIVISDLIPAEKGMLIDPVEDEKALQRLKMDANDKKRSKQ